MSRNQRLDATITVGSVLQASVKRNFSVIQGGLDAVGSELREVTKRQREMSKQSASLRKAGQNVEHLDHEYAQLGRTLDELRRKQQRFERAQRAANQVGRSFNRAASDIGRVARGAAIGVTALGGALYKPVMIAAEFEQNMDRVGAVARATEAELAAMTATARELGASTSWSASDAADGMQYLAMAGFDVNEIIAAMPGMLDLATAGAIELGDAADIASNVLTGFGLNAGDMVRIGDTMANTFTTSNTTLESLGHTMKYVAPVANSLGVSIDEVAAMAGKLGDAGIQGEMAGTALRAIMVRLSAPTSKASDALDQLGVKTKDAAGNMRPVFDIMTDIQKSMEGMGTADRGEIGSVIFGVEALSAATVLLGEASSGSLADYVERLGKAGTVSEVARRQNDNFMGALRRFRSVLEEVAITVGDQLLPVLSTTFDDLGSYLTENRDKIEDFATSLADGLRGAIPILKDIGSGLGTVAVKVGDITAQVADMVGGWENFGILIGGALLTKVMISVGRMIGSVGRFGFAVAGLVGKIGGIGTAMSGAATKTELAATRMNSAMSRIKFGAALAAMQTALAINNMPEDPEEREAWQKKNAEGMESRLRNTPIVGGAMRTYEGVRDWYHDDTGDTPPLAFPSNHPMAQKRAVGGAFAPGPLLVGERGPERMWADRAGYVENNRSLERAARLADRARAGLSEGLSGGLRNGGETTIHVTINALGTSAREVIQEIERIQRRAAGGALFDGPTTWGQYG